MKIILADTNKAVIDAWNKSGGKDYVDTHHGSVFDLEWDALITPGNSFGFMNGGIDKKICMNFGKNIETRLQNHIKKRLFKELKIGEVAISSISDKFLPIIIYAPTMRVPMTIKDTVNVYLAIKAALFQADIISSIKTVALPGMGTGVGQVPPEIFCRQFKAACEEVLEGRFTYPKDWTEASSRHQLLYTDSPRNLQHELQKH